jgi:hypothetical protein
MSRIVIVILIYHHYMPTDLNRLLTASSIIRNSNCSKSNYLINRLWTFSWLERTWQISDNSLWMLSCRGDTTRHQQIVRLVVSARVRLTCQIPDHQTVNSILVSGREPAPEHQSVAQTRDRSHHPDRHPQDGLDQEVLQWWHSLRMQDQTNGRHMA